MPQIDKLSGREEEWPVEKLKTWIDNPRSIDKEQFTRLVESLKKGLHKRLLITEDGTIIGGNMRYEALKELGWKKIPVTVVDAKTDKEKVDYAFRDNDSFGEYEAEEVAELIHKAKLSEKEISLYQLQMGKKTPLKSILGRFGPSGLDGKEEVQFTRELLESQNYVVLTFKNDPDWQAAESVFGLETVAALDSKDGYSRQGVGRVVDGSKYVRSLQKAMQDAGKVEDGDKPKA